MLPHVRGVDIWGQIDRELESRFPSGNDLIGVRDFWNGFHGIAMGFKLKNGLTQILTAENVHWKFIDNLPLDDNLAGGGDLKYISEELSDNRPRASKLKEFFEKPENKTLADFWRNEFQKHGQTSEPRDSFPIITMQGKDSGQDIFSIYDGNRRMVLAVLEGKESLPAYVGTWTTSDMTPKNFWLPTSTLMDLVNLGGLVNTEESYQHLVLLLQSFMTLSESGKYELLNRVLVGENEFRKKLKKDLF